MEKKDQASSEPIKVGDTVKSKCGACKALTSHIVVSLEGSKPSQVRCSTCKRSHKYRPAAKARANAPVKNPERDQWLKLSPGWADKKATNYAMAKSFKVNDVIEHPKFGLGQVRQMMGPNKMSVLFEAGLKLMACQR